MEPTFLHCRGNVNTLTGAPMVLRNNTKSSGVSYLANSLVVKDDFQQQSLMSKQCAEYVFRFQAQFSKHIFLIAHQLFPLSEHLNLLSFFFGGEVVRVAR
jgi:hypothetical protein